MLDLVPQVMQIWKMQRSQLEIVGADIKSRIEAMEKRTPQKELGKEVLQDAYDRLTLDFDKENGGFGTAPKFPRPHNLLFLLRYYARTGEKNALSMVEKTLTADASGRHIRPTWLWLPPIQHRRRNGWFPTLKKCSTTKR